MTSTNVIQQFFHQIRHEGVKTASFKPGQIFYGKVTKLFPNQMAEVTVGQQKLIAHLETPLSANERYWFQVQPGEGKVHLKVLTSNQGADTSRFMGLPGDILAKLSLAQSKENLLLVRFLMKEQLPITKEMLTVASEWLKQSTDLSKSLQTIKEVITQQLPMTKEVLSAIQSMKSAEPIHLLLTKLHTQLTEGKQTDVVHRLISMLEKINVPIKEMIGENGVRNTINNWLGGNMNEQKAAFQLLQTIGLFPKSVSEQTVFRQFFEVLTNEQHKVELSTTTRYMLQQIDRLLQAGKREEAALIVRQLIGNGDSVTSARFGEQVTEPVIIERAVKHTLQQMFTAMNRSNFSDPLTFENSFNRLFQLVGNDRPSFSQVKVMMGEILAQQLLSKEQQIDSPFQLSKQEQLLVRQIVEQLEQTIPRWEQKEFVQRAILQIVKTLGLNYEHELQTTKLADLEDSIKPLLIRYMSEQPFSQGRDSAEQLLNRLTGMQLLSQESGPLQQLLLQIPVQLWNKTVDLTMQWSGRKTDDGKIDPNFCRVLFYLQLEHIEETIIDLQVQNRIMKITIMNDRSDLKQIGAPFLKQLRENIGRGYYQLSSISFESLQKQTDADAHFKPLSIITENQYTGVDIRI